MLHKSHPYNVFASLHTTQLSNLCCLLFGLLESFKAFKLILSIVSQYSGTYYLKIQVEELQTQVKCLGGKLDREKAVSPPPMPDISLYSSSDNEGHIPRSASALEKENTLLKQRIDLIEMEMYRLQHMSPNIRRSSCTLHALSSISIGAINEEVLVT